MIEAALKHGVRPRVELYGAPDEAEKWIALGVKDFCFGDECMVYTNFVNKSGYAMREIVNAIK